MGFDIVKTFVVRSSPEQVWSFLTDPERVARCLPGAAITGKLDDHTWQGTMTVKVGPVSSSYKGKVAFEKLDSASRTARIVATGQDVRGRGGADLRLTSSLVSKTPGETEITTSSHVNVTGILAQMGRGMVQDVSDQMFQIFSQRVRAELESAPGAAPPSPGPTTAPSPAPSTAPSPGPPPAKAEALDIGAMGARAAVRRPVFWIAVAAAAVLAYLLFR
jgi:carbon monoxide dehydrogenase subunit G